jgi:hypothetical protein
MTRSAIGCSRWSSRIDWPPCPRASVVTIEDSYTFVPEDQPELLAGLVVDFARANAKTLDSR